MNATQSHPPRSPFLRKGEDNTAPFLRKKGAQSAGGCLGLFAAACAFALALTTPAAVAAVSPNITAVQPDHIDAYWLRTNTYLNVDVPNSGINLDKPTCAAVTYMIGSDGVTRDIVVRKVIPNGDLRMVAASAVKDFHYVVGAGNPSHEPVFTYIIIPFNLPADPAERKKITDSCVLPGFPQGYR